MLMVIFGAGASYDSAEAFRLVYPGGGGFGPGYQTPPSDPGGPWRPPLAKDLFVNPNHVFGDIVERYPKLSHILPNLRALSNNMSVEQTLESFQEEAEGNSEGQRELASVRFYLCELLNKITSAWGSRTNWVTNYGPLIRKILLSNKTGEQVCLVTFNYELLLEYALYTFDFRPRVPEEYLDSHQILKLFRLHGSVDWSRLVDSPAGPLSPQELIRQAEAIQVSKKFIRGNACDPNTYSSSDRPVLPAIAIPMQTKTEQSFECPSSHLEYLLKMLPYITKILIIGWQGKEAHFTQMLRRKLASVRHVMVVGRNESDSREVLTRFLVDVDRAELGQNTTASARFLGNGGFTHFIVNHEGEEFFRA